MNWLDMFCFTSVARTQSFSVTAQELMISQQAVSRHIKALEDELGVPLFLRGSQRIRLTIAGERMLQYFSRRGDLLEEFKRSASSHKDASVLRVVSSHWLGLPAAFQPILDRFRQRHPEITVLLCDLSSSEMLETLQRGDADILLTTRYAAGYLPIQWQITPIFEEPIYWVASSDTFAPHSISFRTHMADTAGEPDESCIRARVLTMYDRLGLRPGPLEFYPEMGSVCMNLLLRDGVSLGVEKPALWKNPDYELLPTGLTATAVLCVPPHSGRTPADELLFCAKEAQS